MGTWKILLYEPTKHGACHLWHVSFRDSYRAFQGLHRDAGGDVPFIETHAV